MGRLSSFAGVKNLPIGAQFDEKYDVIEGTGGFLEVKVMPEDLSAISEAGSDFARQRDAVVAILKRTYADEPAEDIVATVNNNLFEILREIQIAMRLTTRKRWFDMTAPKEQSPKGV